MKLPLLISVPHAGTWVPAEAERYCILSARDIAHDGDEGAREIYDIADRVEAYVSTSVARAIVDMNRAPTDLRADGVIKTHTCWNVPVYQPPLPDNVARTLLERYHRPYHERLTHMARNQRVVAGVDCHTMAATAPPQAPDPGAGRPRICLSNADGTLPDAWFHALANHLEMSFGFAPSLNRPFRGGHIIRAHSHELPWVQLELSREPWIGPNAKRQRVVRALAAWVESIRLLREADLAGSADPAAMR